MTSKRRAFTEEFKKEATVLARTSTKTLREISTELGVGYSTLTKWKVEYDKFSTRKPRVATALNEIETEVFRLKRDNDRLRKENDILKKATAFFAKDHLSGLNL